MRWSQTLIPTQRQDPADATIASHKLLVRGGFVRQLSAGHYTFLPMGWRAMRKIMGIIREEMEAAGATEVSLPCLQPIELWQESGRDEKYGDDMFRLTDRRGSRQALAPTHEESVTEFVRAFVKSYKQLPLNVWQMQTKFRDEPRPRSGLLRVREFIMKDAYSLDADEAGLDKSFQAMRAAYKSIYARCGVPAIEVDADSGAIGGSESIEFTVPCDAGEDVVVTSDKGNYAANVEKAAIGERAFDLEGEPTGELEKVHTPDMPGIELVCKHLKVKPPRMLKTLVFTRSDGKGFVIGVVPGDKQVTAAKLQAAAGVGPIELDEASARSAGFAIGYVGPHVVNDREDTMLVVDPDAAQGGFWATGANERDHHVKHFNWARDVETKPVVADIRDAVDGDPSPKNDGGVLKESRGVEVGHVFKLGTVYSEKMVATFLDENNAEKPVIMGCYGIGVGRILLSAVETSHDDRGIIWPINIAPCEVVVTPIKYEGVAKTKADMIYDELQSKGVDVLLDDRDDRPGSKFADADLIGIPLRVVVGDRGLEKEGGGVVEVKERQSGETHEVPVDGVVDAVIKRLASLRR
jgi:prolyl-tRNA synthetase